MKKIIAMLFHSMVVCAVFAQNNVGGNVNSKEPISYADKSFLSGILDYDSLRSKPIPQNWPAPLDNTFKFTYTTGECKIFPSQFLFDAAEKLGVEKEFTTNQIDSEYYPESTCKLTGIAIQKTNDEYLIRAFYEADDVIHASILNMDKRPWYINDSPKKHLQVIHKPGNDVVKIVDDAYCVYHFDDPLGAFIGFKVFSIFDLMPQKRYAHTQIVFGFENEKEINLNGVVCKLFEKKNIKKAIHKFGPDNSELFDPDERKFTESHASFFTPDVLIENRVFQYTIDKMLDSNPATSFVENSTDDNISFTFDFNDVLKNIKEIKIINGFAKNENLYKSNNQVKTISVKAYGTSIRTPIYEKTFELEQTMDFQFIELNIANCRRLEIKSTQLYKGTKYNDTCIAEFDVLTDEGWLISGK